VCTCEAGCDGLFHWRVSAPTHINSLVSRSAERLAVRLRSRTLTEAAANIRQGVWHAHVATRPPVRGRRPANPWEPTGTGKLCLTHLRQPEPTLTCHHRTNGRTNEISPTED
jgi:hypothetical protein